MKCPFSSTHLLAVCILIFALIDLNESSNWRDMQTNLENAKTLLNELDTFGSLKYDSDPCDTTTLDYKDYNDLIEGIQKKNVDAIVDTAIKRLHLKLEEIKKSPPAIGLFCAVTNGFTCNPTTKKCDCNDPHKRGEPPQLFYNSTINKCVLQEFSSCDLSWDYTFCDDSDGDMDCILEEKTQSDPEYKLPWSLCKETNRWKWNLDDSNWKCTCQYNREKKHAHLQKFRNDLFKLPKLKHNVKCESALSDLFYTKLNSATESIDAANDFYNSADHKELLKKYNEAKGVTPLFCDHTVPVVCKNDTCSCFDEEKDRYDPSKGRCILPKGGNCHHSGFPGDCAANENCIIAVANVSCTEQNLKELRHLNIHIRYSSCKCSSEEYKPYLTKEAIKTLTNVSHSFLKSEIIKIDDAKETYFEILPTGSDCTVKEDQLYFQFKDFIFAEKEHVYYRLTISKEVKDRVKQINDKKAKAFKVCDLSKGMRCGFLSKKCECAIDGYFSEDIQSVFNDPEKRCMLPSGSLCHSNLPDWLPCQNGEKCLYKEVPVLCNRKNKNIAIEKNIRLKSAKCYCSSRKDFSDTFDDKIHQQYINSKLHRVEF